MAADAGSAPESSAPQPADQPSGPGAGSKARRSPNALFCFLHLAVLTTFALAQPLFNLLGENPEFFAARGSTPSEVIVFGALVVVVPPLVFLIVELLVGLVSRSARLVVHYVLLALLAALVFVQALKGSLGSSDLLLIGVALVLGGLAAALYARAEPVRSFLSVLSPAPLFFLVLFLFISPVSKITMPSDASAKSAGEIRRVPVVMVVFDEFPSGSLLDSKHHVDAKRYPGFAQLAKDGTWFRNAHSIYDSTSKAVPAIMDGDYPVKDKLPTASDHPNSIFAVLGKSHRMNVSEEATTVCPRDLCSDDRLDKPFAERLQKTTDDLSLVYAHMVAPPKMEQDLPSVSETWGDFGGGGGGGSGASGASDGAAAQADSQAAAGKNERATLKNLRGGRSARYAEWLGRIRPGTTLNFKHILMPHVPWQYLPDGRLYSESAAEPIPGISRQSYKDADAVDQLQMRHLLQVGFADLLLRRTIARLKQQGIYDDALVVVTADHGVSFRKGQFDRRKVNSTNIDEISPVPLFVKAPDQRRGKIDDTIVETTDIFPTIADVLQAKLPAKTDGISAFSAKARERDEVKMLKRDLSGWVRLSEDKLDAEKQEVLDKKLRLFGEGADGPDRIYRFGPNRQLLGKRVSQLQTAGRSSARATLSNPGALRNVDPDGAVLPSWITGRVSGASSRDIAIAVNGTVQAVTDSYRLATGGGQIFGALVPESALRKGANDVEIYEVSGGSRLAPMGGGR